LGRRFDGCYVGVPQKGNGKKKSCIWKVGHQGTGPLPSFPWLKERSQKKGKKRERVEKIDRKMEGGVVGGGGGGRWWEGS